MEQTLDSMREGFQVIGFDWRYVFVNRAVAEQGRSSKEELLGRTMMECYPGIESTEMFAMLRRCMEERVPIDMENEFTYADGQKAWFELRIQPCPQGLSILSLDITQRKRLEAQLRQSQRLDGIGKLAGGVAHDLNNLLTIVSSYASFVGDELPEGSALAADVKEIVAATQRASRLTQQLMAVARAQATAPQRLSVNDCVHGFTSSMHRLLPANVTLDVHARPSPWEVLMDSAALERVLLNLTLNARDAMPGGGVISIETDTLTLGERSPAPAPQMVPGDYVVLRVSDTGEGMTPEVQERLFEPFFTTKAAGAGTGLGLLTSHGIIRQAGGFIAVASTPGRGTRFEIYLPRMQAAPALAPALVEQPSPPGQRTVLCTDDDPQVRALVRRTLESAGYRVLLAATPTEAVAIAEQNPNVLHIAFARYPVLKGVRVLEKPFTPRALASAVRALAG